MNEFSRHFFFNKLKAYINFFSINIFKNSTEKHSKFKTLTSEFVNIQNRNCGSKIEKNDIYFCTCPRLDLIFFEMYFILIKC